MFKSCNIFKVFPTLEGKLTRYKSRKMRNFGSKYKKEKRKKGNRNVLKWFDVG